jgi:hypothetical protein
MWDFVLFFLFFSLIPSLSCLYFLASSHVPCCSKAGASNSKDMGGDSVVYCTEKIMFPFWGGKGFFGRDGCFALKAQRWRF